MTDVFVAGALALPNVLDRVLGRDLSPDHTAPAILRDHALVICDPAHHPAVVPQTGAQVGGLLVRGLTDLQVEAITHYEMSFGRKCLSVEVEAERGPVTVQAFTLAEREVEPETSELDGAAADLRDWAKDWADVAACMAREIMAFQGRKPASDLTKSLYSMRIRANAWCRAQSRQSDPDHDLARDVIVHAHKREYINFFAMEEMDLQHRKFDGTMGPLINRGVLLVGEAAVLLPYDVKRDAVLLIEQFRAAIFIAGEVSPWTLEPPAGLMDPGETPEEAARRETLEEAGLEVSHLEPVASLYPSSGSSGEYVHIFCGLTDFSSIEGGGGVPSEGEDIRSKVISFQELMQGVDNRTFQDMPLVTAALWLARHRDRLRAEFG
ncbi:NUDIX domain-containing protein [Tritonibacter horizontis]|uniref:ADP-ribose pyrophosphatase n=1 Tax=Tritonibacter horizontis TaxID=1768241 RepID=A0A132BSI6_9RHOB|nr:NUDIX domain-containing protein [Tritonibacter horizontis]KUP91365.1 ADP-ribose pyrophosphatase [Tritonibacter horizontis]